MSTDAVRLDGVGRRFGRAVALDDVSFDLQAGEVLGLLGPNGAGKTTAMRIITGYLRPDRGSVTIDGMEAGRNRVACRRLIGYLPESAPVPRELTVSSFLTSCARLRGLRGARGRDAVVRSIDDTGLSEAAESVIGTLSKGYRQRVGLAQALVHDPPILILDEPTAGLDPRQVTETRSLIARLGRKRAVLLSSHLLSEVAALCRRVVVLDRGAVIATRSVAELTTKTQSGVPRLDVRVAGDPQPAVAALRRLSDVASADVKGSDRILVIGHRSGSSPTPLAAAVSGALGAAGIALIELRAHDETLEDAYLRLVRE